MNFIDDNEDSHFLKWVSQTIISYEQCKEIVAIIDQRHICVDTESTSGACRVRNQIFPIIFLLLIVYFIVLTGRQWWPTCGEGKGQ
jgi:hypothetical protein